MSTVRKGLILTDLSALYCAKYQPIRTYPLWVFKAISPAAVKGRFVG